MSARGRALVLAALAAGPGCGASPPPAPAAARAASPAPPRAGPAWLYDVPAGCALGDSGPTLRPTDALVEARRRARARLVAQGAAIRTRAVAVTHAAGAGTGQREVVLEEAEGTVTGSVIVAMWYDADGRGPEGAPGCAYATACLRAAPTPEAARWIRAVSGRRGGPPWIYGRGGAGRLCALGISGPTLEPAAARVHAEEAGRAELAAAIALRARTATAIFDAEEILFGAVTLPCAPCAEAARHGQVAASWQDERGEGPLPFPGTAYALLCTDP